MMISYAFLHSPINSSFGVDLKLRSLPHLSSPSSISSSFSRCLSLRVALRRVNPHLGRRELTLQTTLVMFSENLIVSDACATLVSSGIALSLLRIWQETAERGIFDQKLNRKLVHTSVGLVFMLCWPLFSSGRQGALLAALIPGINIVKVLLIGLGILKDEATVKSMSRFGDYRELIKGPLYYASTITLACAIYWRTSPLAIAAVCNLCAGDGFADIVGRRFGREKLPYNREKSYAGSIAMVTASFIASIGFMHYFSMFGYLKESWEMVFGFLVVSIASALVESHPLSSTFDDNLTVPLTSLLVGILINFLFMKRIQSDKQNFRESKHVRHLK